MSRTIAYLAGLIMSFLFALQSQAAPFLLSEPKTTIGSLPAEFGDLPASVDGLSTPFPIDFGTNVITGGFGCIGFGCGNLDTNNKDVFRIEVPTGIAVTTTIMKSPGVHLYQLAPNGGSFIIDEFVGAETIFDTTLSSGIYDLAVIKSGSGGWEWNFIAEAVTPVPIPAAFVLFASAFGLLTLGKRSRQRT